MSSITKFFLSRSDDLTCPPLFQIIKRRSSTVYAPNFFFFFLHENNKNSPLEGVLPIITFIFITPGLNQANAYPPQIKIFLYFDKNLYSHQVKIYNKTIKQFVVPLAVFTKLKDKKSFFTFPLFVLGPLGTHQGLDLPGVSCDQSLSNFSLSESCCQSRFPCSTIGPVFLCRRFI